MIGKLKLVISDYLYGLNFKEDDFYELRKKGFVKLSPLKDDDINNLVKEIDSLDYDDEVTSHKYPNSGDTRFFFDENNKFHSIKKLGNENISFLSDKLKKSYASHRMSMINVLDASKREGDFGSGEGWHCDSPFSHQLKIFTFLTKVSSENGPLRIIPFTHSSKNKLKIHNYLRKDLSDFRYTEEEIKKLLESDEFSIKEMTCEPGSRFLVDTRIIHAGKPINKEKRIAVTDYYFKNINEKDIFKKSI